MFDDNKKTQDVRCITSENSAARPTWKRLAEQYHNLRILRGRSKGYFKQEYEGKFYLFLGLSAATGKVMTQAKRGLGGDSDYNYAELKSALSSVRIYTEQLARELEIDLDSESDAHMHKVLERSDNDKGKKE